MKIRAKKSHHNGGTRAGDDFFDSFLQVSENIAIESWIVVDHFLDLIQRLFVIGFLIDADPEFREVWTDHLVCDLRTADV